MAALKTSVKNYPHMPRDTVLRGVVASQPEKDDKWLTDAKHARFFKLAIELAKQSPSDPRTLIGASRDFVGQQQAFALAAGKAAQ